MPALDFPANPTNGQVYGNWIYDSTKGAWKAKPLTPGQAQPSATAPTAPNNGDQWYNTNDGSLYVYYNDGDTAQWVQIKSDATLSSTLGPRVDALEVKSPNYIINGNFDIWQRGTSQTTTGYGSADRWYNLVAGTTTVSQETSDLPTGSRYGLKYVTGAASSYAQFHQMLETATVVPLRGKTVTLSFYAKVAGGYSGNIGVEVNYSNTTTDASYSGNTLPITVSGSGSAPTIWTRLSFSFTVPADALSLRVGIIPTVAQASGVTVRVAQVQLEDGAVATPFRRSMPTLQGELAACQRYYYAMSNAKASGTNFFYAAGSMYQPLQGIAVIHLPVEMRSVPSVSASGAFQALTSQTNVPLTNVSPNTTSLNTVGMNITTNISLNAGAAFTLAGLNAASSITFSSEL